MKKIFNDKVSNIFAYGKYMFPRWKYTTLQVPTQGMGQWCHPQSISVIDDRGIRNKASRNNNRFIMPQGIPFSTPGEKNIIILHSPHYGITTRLPLIYH